MKPFQSFALIHKWAGLGIFIFIILIGLTGAMLVFKPELDRLLNPDLFHATPTATPIPIERIIHNVRVQHRDERPSEIIFGEGQNEAVIVRFDGVGSATSPFGMEIFADPGTGRINGSRILEDGPFDRRSILYYIRRFHFELLLGEYAYVALGFIALIWLITTIVGLYLSWPRAGRWWAMFTVHLSRNRFRTYYELHRASGVISFAPMLLIIGTALWWNMDYAVRPLVYGALQTQPVQAPGHIHDQSTAEPKVPAFSVDDMLDEAAHIYPGTTALRVTFDYHARQYILWLAGPDQGKLVWRAPDMNGGGDVLLWFNMDDGHIVDRLSGADAGAGDIYDAVQLPLHTGSYFGIAGRLIWLIVGLVPILLGVTGLYLWLKKRRKPPIKRAIRKLDLTQ